MKNHDWSRRVGLEGYPDGREFVSQRHCPKPMCSYYLETQHAACIWSQTNFLSIFSHLFIYFEAWLWRWNEQMDDAFQTVSDTSKFSQTWRDRRMCMSMCMYQRGPPEWSPDWRLTLSNMNYPCLICSPRTTRDPSSPASCPGSLACLGSNRELPCWCLAGATAKDLIDQKQESVHAPSSAVISGCHILGRRAQLLPSSPLSPFSISLDPGSSPLLLSLTYQDKSSQLLQAPGPTLSCGFHLCKWTLDSILL